MAATTLRRARVPSGERWGGMLPEDDGGVARVGVLTTSDRAVAGVYADLGGPAIVEFLTTHLATPVRFVTRLVPDERDVIGSAIRDLVDVDGCCLVVTTGGTGPAPRDVTPEATADCCDRMMPGFGELMRAVSLQSVPTAILSRQTAGIRGGALIVNLPGKPAAIAECLGAVLPAIPYCIDLIGGPRLDLREPMAAFRPKGS